MPSLLAKLGLRRSQPKVFVKALDTVAKTLKPSRRNKKNKGKNVEVVVAAAPVAATEAPGVQENNNYHDDDGVDLTNSVMLLNKLSILQEESFQEKEEQASIIAAPTQAISEPVNGEREDSMDTFIEHLGDAEEESIVQDDIAEEKTNRSLTSSPITVIPLPVEEEQAPIVVADREASNSKVDEVSVQSEEVVAVVEPVQIISEAAVVEVIAPVQEVPTPKQEFFATNSKPAVLETIRRATLAARPVSNNVGSLRARFETNANTSKPLTPVAPTSLKSVLAARNNAKFAERKLEAAAKAVEPAVVASVEETKPQEEVPAVVVVVEAVQSTPIVQEEVPVVAETAPATSEVAESAQKEEEPIVEEVKTVVVAVEEVKVEVDHSAAVAAIARAGDEKALFASMLEIASKTYKEQAVWFLNAYWNETFKNDSAACERVWRFAGKFAELDQAGAKGFELDEIRAHRVLEVLAEAMTITEMRTKFHRRAKHVSLIELLIFIFSADWTQVVLAPQGSEQALEQMQQAEALMAKSSAAVEESKQKASQSAADERRAGETAKQALDSKNKAVAGETQATEAETRAIECEQAASARAEEAAEAFSLASKAAEEAAHAEAETVKRAEESARAEEEARQVQEQAVKAETRAVDDEQRAREAESEAFRREVEAKDSEQRAVEAERILIDDQARVEAALNKVKEEEAAFNKLLQDLKATSENESIGIVARRKAAHEREMLLAKDPDPLTRARIAEEAVVRKHEKQIRLAAQARAAATDARSGSEKSRDRAVSARIASEGARSEAAIRRSASETKAAAAVEARELSDAARASATAAREESEARRKASDEALESARRAKEEASAARTVAAEERALATEAKVQAESHEREALAAKALASQSRENAESAVVEAVNAFERARQFVERVRKQASSGQGGWWWASREIEDAKRYVPQRMLKKLAEEQQMF